jgi:putative thioredoxin
MNPNDPFNPFSRNNPLAGIPLGAMPGAAGGAAPANDNPFSFDTTDLDFEAKVLEQSLHVPVLLDCWAPWCGPCRSLGPVLEKLAKAYGGRFLLAKVNTDESPQVAAAMGIRSIPQVTLFIGGRPVDQFMGALPEGQIRAFLDRHLGSDVVDAEANEVGSSTLDPLDEAEALLAEGALAEAQALLDSLPLEARNARHGQLLAQLRLLQAPPPSVDDAALRARIAANPRDFEARFDLAALLVHGGDFKAAFDELLEVVLRDKAEGKPDREKARKQLIEWFNACPDAAIVSHGRRYLGMYLN